MDFDRIHYLDASAPTSRRGSAASIRSRLCRCPTCSWTWLDRFPGGSPPQREGMGDALPRIEHAADSLLEQAVPCGINGLGRFHFVRPSHVVGFAATIANLGHFQTHLER